MTFVMWLALVEQLFYNQSMEMSTEVHNEPVPIEPLTAETIRPRMLVRLEDGRTGRVASNLAIQDTETGLFADGRYVETKITAENRQQYRERRYQLAREAAERGVITANTSLKLKTINEAYAHMIGKQFEIACDPDKGRAATEAAKLLIKVLDLAPDSSEKSASTTNNLNLNISEAQLGALIGRLAAIQAAKRAQTGANSAETAIIDAEVQ